MIAQEKNEFHHITVLEQELVNSLNLHEGNIAIDCTAGGGGHTQGLIRATSPGGQVIAMDRDPSAIAQIQYRFSKEVKDGSLRIEKTKFSDIHDIASKYNLVGKVNGICADIGVSSPQLDMGSRGFSFSHDGPLDMRMDPTSSLTAYQVVNEYSESELTRIFKEFGEEPKAFFVARAIVEARKNRPIKSTHDLAKIAEDSIFYKTKSRTHPGTRIFQAIRIEVNNELDELKRLIEDAITVLAPGGRLGIISFHSLEDRIVKHLFKEAETTAFSRLNLKGIPMTENEIERLGGFAKGKIIKPFPVLPKESEQTENPRSRSAKLRVLEKNSRQ